MILCIMWTVDYAAETTDHWNHKQKTTEKVRYERLTQISQMGTQTLHTNTLLIVPNQNYKNPPFFSNNQRHKSLQNTVIRT